MYIECFSQCYGEPYVLNEPLKKITMDELFNWNSLYYCLAFISIFSFLFLFIFCFLFLTCESLIEVWVWEIESGNIVLECIEVVLNFKILK